MSRDGPWAGAQGWAWSGGGLVGRDWGLGFLILPQVPAVLSPRARPVVKATDPQDPRQAGAPPSRSLRPPLGMGPSPARGCGQTSCCHMLSPGQILRDIEQCGPRLGLQATRKGRPQEPDRVCSARVGVQSGPSSPKKSKGQGGLGAHAWTWLGSWHEALCDLSSL